MILDVTSIEFRQSKVIGFRFDAASLNLDQKCLETRVAHTRTNTI